MAEANRDDEEHLVRGALDGDEESFRRLVALHWPRTFRLVRGILGDWQHSEDVCQEVFVKVYAKLPGFRFQSQFSTWLYRVAVNAALRARGRAARERGSVALDALEAGPACEDGAVERLDEQDLVAKVLRPLPSHLRAVVLLKEREGMSYREIASVLGCSQGAVEQRLRRAFVRLRETWQDKLDELGLEGPGGDPQT